MTRRVRSARSVAGLTRPTGPNLMTEDEPTDEISEIEAQIEELAESAERSRRIILGSKIAIAGGFGLLLIALLGLFGAGQTAALGSIALVLGGIVSLGSNVSTLRQTEAAISTAEARRARLIGNIDLRLVHDAPLKLM
ncbi:HAMP domain-containing protein [Bradyrhizobium sp. USDA 4524]